MEFDADRFTAMGVSWSRDGEEVSFQIPGYNAPIDAFISGTRLDLVPERCARHRKLIGWMSGNTGAE